MRPEDETEEHRLRRVAYHEAGHAVISLVLRRSFKHVTTIPGDGTLGHCLGVEFQGEVDPSLNEKSEAQARKWLEDHIVILFAGEAAAAALLGRGNEAASWGTQHDYDSASQMALVATGGDPDEAGAYCSWLAFRAWRLVRQQPTWAMIEGLAAALLTHRTLGYRRARAVALEARQAWLQARLQAAPAFRVVADPAP